MLTRCPDCATHFLVTAEQLKIRSGRVRCGQCQHVFNALDSLIEEPALALAQATKGATALTQGLPAGIPRDVGARLPTEGDAIPPSPPTVAEAEPVPSPSPDSVDHTVARAALPEPEIDDVTEPDAAALVADLAAEPDAAMPMGVEVEAPASGEPPDDSGPPSDAGSTEIVDAAVEGGDGGTWEDAFTPPAPQRRWPWVLGSAAALGALAVQATIAFRVELATVWPDARPALTALCDFAGCEVGLPAKPGLIRIDASDLHPDGGQASRLVMTATIKNLAPFSQQFPHLELTLTDTNDKAVARKVLAPADYLSARTPLADGMAPNVDVAAGVVIDAGGLAASGYRLYAFYP